ncbi:hypothetical protein MUP01_13985 [Candidatus Bathyarchaeota archaeon]|nr:hypothetical protein [Candidatus Bathyarchaeota archaeon]
MKEQKEFTTLSIDLTTSDYLDYLSAITGKPKATVLKMILEQLVSIGASMKKGTILRFESSVLTKSVTITFDGASRLMMGSFEAESDEIGDKKLKEKLKE